MVDLHVGENVDRHHESDSHLASPHAGRADRATDGYVRERLETLRGSLQTAKTTD